MRALLAGLGTVQIRLCVSPFPLISLVSISRCGVMPGVPKVVPAITSHGVHKAFPKAGGTVARTGLSLAVLLMKGSSMAEQQPEPVEGQEGW